MNLYSIHFEALKKLPHEEKHISNPKGTWSKQETSLPHFHPLYFLSLNSTINFLIPFLMPLQCECMRVMGIYKLYISTGNSYIHINIKVKTFDWKIKENKRITHQYEMRKSLLIASSLLQITNDTTCLYLKNPNRDTEFEPKQKSLECLDLVSLPYTKTNICLSSSFNFM